MLQAVLTQIWAPPVYELEVDFFVDKSLMNKYAAEESSVRDGLISLKADINYILTEMNEIFASLRPMGLHIVILKRKLSLLRINLFSDNLPSKLGLKAFDDWLAKQGPATYDAAILYTGQNSQDEGKKQLNTNENRISFSG
ncbi:hypothetical protein PoB_007306200 [Plakobranchus ocellatus]|uniref:Uncharacterized protein n=1 Tax=Plakobranchus ocellatus TaxID=259542 RepID=A0AAV4DQK6_9GAST|nr:hypothetical protein PoB_007306200 [Plakobranchus ocellatus]